MFPRTEKRAGKEREDTMRARFLVLLYAVLCTLGLIAGSAFGEVNFSGEVDVKAGTTVENAVSFGGPVRIYGTVTDAAVSIGGDVVVEEGGRVLGDAVAVGGKISVKDSAVVEGDAVALGGTVDIAPTGAVRGEIVRGGPPFLKGCGFSPDRLMKSAFRFIVLGPFFGFLGALGATIYLILFVLKTLFWLACAVIVQYLFSERTDRMAEALRVKFAPAFFFGVLFLFLTPFFLLFLLISLIGIPFLPLAVGLLLVMYLFGSTGVALWAGRLFPNASTRSGTLNVLLGVLTISLVRLIPGIGFLVWIVLVSVSLGITVLTRFGGRRSVPAPR